MQVSKNYNIMQIFQFTLLTIVVKQANATRFVENSQEVFCTAILILKLVYSFIIRESTLHCSTKLISTQFSHIPCVSNTVVRHSQAPPAHERQNFLNVDIL